MSLPEGAIAIVGVAGRFPGADDVGRFWQNMRAGVTSIARFTDAELEDSFPPSVRNDPNFVRARAILENVGDFDADFFAMLPRQAALPCARFASRRLQRQGNRPWCSCFPGRARNTRGWQAPSIENMLRSGRRSTKALRSQTLSSAPDCARYCWSPRPPAAMRPCLRNPRCSYSSMRLRSSGCPGASGPPRWSATASASSLQPAWPGSFRSTRAAGSSPPGRRSCRTWRQGRCLRFACPRPRCARSSAKHSTSPPSIPLRSASRPGRSRTSTS